MKSFIYFLFTLFLTYTSLAQSRVLLVQDYTLGESRNFSASMIAGKTTSGRIVFHIVDKGLGIESAVLTSEYSEIVTRHGRVFAGQPRGLTSAASGYLYHTYANTPSYRTDRTGLSGSVLESTQTIIANNLRPLTENVGDANYPGNDLAMAAKNIIYSSDPEINGEHNLKAAITKKDAEDTRQLFALIAAEQSFDVAKSKALVFKYFTISNTEKYAYFVRTDRSNLTYKDIFGAIENDATQLTTFVPIESVFAETLVDQIQIYWNAEATSYMYSTYSLDLTDNKYIHEVNPKVMLDTIFFRVLATDRRENNSDQTEIPPVERPDKSKNNEMPNLL